MLAQSQAPDHPLAGLVDSARIGVTGISLGGMTTTLVAVYAPIGFMGGLVGTLFTEFAFALAGAVLVSGVVALTLSPMLSSRVLKSSSGEGRLPHQESGRCCTLGLLLSPLGGGWFTGVCGSFEGLSYNGK